MSNAVAAALARATPTSGQEALLDGGLGVAHGVLDAVLALLELDLGGRPDLDDHDATGQLGEPLPQLVPVVAGVTVVDLVAKLGDPTGDLLGVAGPIDDSGVVLGHDNLAGPAERVQPDVLQGETGRLADDLPTGEDGDVGAAEPNSRLRACLDRAGAAAQADGAAEIGTHHLHAGLLAEGVAAAILERLGVTTDAILASGQRLFGPSPGQPAEHVPPMSAEATCAVDAAARHAVTTSPDSPCPEVRTEHLLFVLARDMDGRARRVLNDLGTDIAVIKRELECYVTGRPRRRGSRWKRPAAASGRACSFCGRSERVAGRLVAGPGVYICAGCVALAADILRREAA